MLTCHCDSAKVSLSFFWEGGLIIMGNLQDEELNKNGYLYIERHPKIKIKVVDGSSLAVAVLLNSIPKGTTQVLLRGNLTKVAFSLASALCQRDIQVYLHLFTIFSGIIYKWCPLIWFHQKYISSNFGFIQIGT